MKVLRGSALGRSMHKRFGRGLIAAGAVVAVTAGITVAPGSAGAATVVPEYIGSAGSTLVTVLNGTLRSDITAQSYIDTTKVPDSNANSTLAANFANIASVGAFESSISTAPVPGVPVSEGGQIVSHSRAAGLNILDGLIKIDALDTVTTVTRKSATDLTTKAQTTFVGIHIAGIDLPLTIPQNFGVVIPGIASIQLNAVFTWKDDQGQMATSAAGLYVTLFKGVGNNPAGTEFYINPTLAIVKNLVTGPGTLGGGAFSTQLVAKGAGILGLNSGPTSFQPMPPGGTDGKTQSNSLAALNIPGVLQIGVLSSTANGKINDDGSEYSTTTNETGGINFLNGLIKADALKVTAHAERAADGKITFQHDFQLLNLSIAGYSVPISVPPNTTFALGDLFRITLYGTATTVNGVGVVAIQIQLLNPYGPFQTGTILTIGGAWATVE